jgi:hypothetical protein
MTSILQNSFTGGELSPNLWSRSDLARYLNSLKVCRNMIVQPYGGAKNRPGTRCIVRVKGVCRLIPFRFSPTQNYLLEVGNLYIRIVIAGVQQVVATSPAWVTATAYAVNDRRANGGNSYSCLVAHTSGTFATDLAAGKWALVGATGAIAEVVTPYLQSELSLLKFSQSNDVITITHSSHEPMNLSRIGVDYWTLKPIASTNGPWLEMNLDSTFSFQVNKTVGTATLTSTKDMFTTAKHAGRLVYIEQRTYGKPWEVQKSITKGDIRRSDGKYYQAQNTATTGTLRPTHTTDTWLDGDAGVQWLYLHSGFGIARIDTVLTPKTCSVTILSRMPDELSATGTGFGTLVTLGAVPYTDAGDGYLLITKVAHGITTTGAARVVVTGSGGSSLALNILSLPTVDTIKVDLDYATFSAYYSSFDSIEPPAATTLTSDRWRLGAWGGDQGWPSVVAYYQNRRVYAGSTTQPQTVWATRTNAYNDFSTSTPIQDDDALTFTLASDQVDTIKGIIAMGQLLMLSDGVEWALTAGQSEVTTPGNIATKPQGFRGSSDLKPLAVGDGALFVQSMGQVVRDLGYEWQTNQFKGNDLTVFADHLVEGLSIIDWTYQQHPFGIVWMVRSDGALLGLTYMREQQVFGWHRHDTDGTVESVSCVRETFNGVDEDAVYLVVNRSTGRFIERMNTRLVIDITKAWFVDCGATQYDAVATNTMSGLSHLEGKTVSCLFDGYVAMNLVVSGGMITLPSAAHQKIAGLPITADMQTVDITNPQGETLFDKKKGINAVRLQVLESRGIWAGQDADHLFEAKTRSDENYDTPVRLQDGLVEIDISTNMSQTGSVFIRQTNPLPITVTALIPEVTIGGV